MAAGDGWNEGDFNGDHKVDDRDAAILAAHWSAGEQAVPEPSVCIGLRGLCLAGCLAAARRRGTAGVRVLCKHLNRAHRVARP